MLANLEACRHVRDDFIMTRLDTTPCNNHGWTTDMTWLIANHYESRVMRHVHPAWLHHRPRADEGVHVHELHQRCRTHWAFHVGPSHDQRAGLSYPVHRLNRVVIILGESRDLNERTKPILLDDPEISASFLDDGG